MIAICHWLCKMVVDRIYQKKKQNKNYNNSFNGNLECINALTQCLLFILQVFYIHIIIHILNQIYISFFLIFRPGNVKNPFYSLYHIIVCGMNNLCSLKNVIFEFFHFHSHFLCSILLIEIVGIRVSALVVWKTVFSDKKNIVELSN